MYFNPFVTRPRTSDPTRSSLRVIERDDAWASAINRASVGGIWVDGVATPRITGYGTNGINIGTNHVTLAFSVAMADYTPAALTYIWQSHSTGNNRLLLGVRTTGSWILQFVDGSGVVVEYALAPDFALVDGETYHVVVTIDRSGLATFYINGESDRDFNGSTVTVSVAASSTLDIGLSNTNPFGYFSGFNGVISHVRVYNRVLTSAQVKTLLKTGVVDFSDQGASLTKIISGATGNGNFETLGGGGADAFASWTETVAGTTTITVETGADKYAGTNSAKLMIDASNSTASLSQGGLVIGKRYRATFYAKCDSGTPSIATDAAAVAANVTSTLTNVWTQYTWEFVATSSTFNIKRNSAANRTIWIDEVVLESFGCIQDLDLGIGIGTHIPDRNATYPGLLPSTTGARHILPRHSGVFTVRRSYLHSEISAVADTTKHLDLPPNAAILNVVANVTTAFDVGTTLNVGITGTGAKFANAMALGAIANVYADSLNKAGESPSVFTNIWLKKSAATATGVVVIRVTYELRGI